MSDELSTDFSLLMILADIREALGFGHKIMLADLPEECRKMKEELDKLK